jgi:hypothetical protein
MNPQGGREVPGVYFLRLAFGEDAYTQKAILLE